MADLTPLQRLDQAIHQLDKRTPPPLELIATMFAAFSDVRAEYERVVKENAELRERLDHYREHRTLLEVEVAVLRPDAERWQAFAPSLDIRKGCGGEWILWPYNAVHGWEDRPESVNAAADRIVNAARAVGEG